MPKFNATELAIAKAMLKQSDWHSTNYIAEQAQIAWETAEKTLKSLFEKGYLVMGKRKRRIYWKLY